MYFHHYHFVTDCFNLLVNPCRTDVLQVYRKRYHQCCSIISPLQVVRQLYHGDKYLEDRQNQTLVFEKDKIILDLPAGDSEPKVVDGWKILPLTYPQVKKYTLKRTLMRYCIMLVYIIDHTYKIFIIIHL